MNELSGASLHVERGLDNLSTIGLDGLSLAFGSSVSADVVIENAFVSRRHFQIRSKDGFYHVSDLDSTNGTYLNGERLLPNVERRVKDGDQITLATNQVVFRFIDVKGPLRLVSSCAGQRQFNPKAGGSDYFVVDAGRALGMYDDLGFIRSASAIQWAQDLPRFRLNPTSASTRHRCRLRDGYPD